MLRRYQYSGRPIAATRATASAKKNASKTPVWEFPNTIAPTPSARTKPPTAPTAANRTTTTSARIGSLPNDHAFSGGAQAPSAATRGWAAVNNNRLRLLGPDHVAASRTIL